MSVLGRVSRRLLSSITRTSDGVRIEALGASFPFVWLRDSCLSPDCVHPSTSQKLHRSSDFSPDIQPADGGVNLTSDGLHIQWADGHASFFPHEFLRRHSSSTQLAAFHRDDTTSARPWANADISRTPHLYVPYSSLSERAGLRSAIDQLTTYGLLFVTGVPHAETSDATCELRALASRFSHIRETFYAQVWDVVNLRDSRNIAYTNLDLGLHMDLLCFFFFFFLRPPRVHPLPRYFHHPPKYQILHCLRNSVHGGASRFVDAFHAAEALRTADPAAFALLAHTPVPFHYINDGHHLHHAHPTLALEHAPPTGGRLAHVNYSPPFQAPLPRDAPPAFYGALKRFAALLEAREREYTYTLREGDAVVFDNRRVLHARTAFSDEGGGKQGEPSRWLKGCYFEADALLDRGRMLRK